MDYSMASQAPYCGARSAAVRRSEALERTSLSDILRLVNAAHAISAETDSYPVASKQVRAGCALFHEGSAADAIYFVGSGSFKSYRTAEDGYEQVLGFTCCGELLGFDALCIGRHPTGVSALEDSRVFVLRSQDVFTLGQRAPTVDRLLHLAVSRELKRQSEIADLMAAVSAEVRVARFLVHYSERMKASGQSSERLLLRMCRRDIASHLGVAHETVSRSFSALVDMGYVRVNNRAVDILDVERLRLLSTSTRSVLDGKPARAANVQNHALKEHENCKVGGKNGYKTNGHTVNGPADGAANSHSTGSLTDVGIDVFSVFAARVKSAQPSANGSPNAHTNAHSNGARSKPAVTQAAPS
jgi:CRP/FNR family transcriptional regulator